MSRRSKLITNDTTKTSRLLLPMLGLNWVKLPDNFYNGYVTKDNEIVLVFEKNGENERFNKFLDFNNTNNDYIKYEEDLDEILLYYKIPDDFVDDYHKFLEGRYSEFSDDYKHLLRLMFGRKTAPTGRTVYVENVIFPQEYKRKQIAEDLGVEISLIKETFDKPDLNEELFIPLIELLKSNNIYVSE